jgi:hypothetical protein
MILDGLSASFDGGTVIRRQQVLDECEAIS